jgi:hypothetical protein
LRLLAAVLFSFLLSAQEPAAPQPAKPKRMPEPKNLQVLKVGPGELIPIMRAYNTALRVQCTFCHVQGDFASDENGHKVTARRMITLTQEINGKLVRTPDSKNVVSCYTCHRGEEHPVVNAPAAAPASPAAPTPPPPAQ